MRNYLPFLGPGPFMPRRRYCLAFIFYGFLILRLIHTGYPPLFSFLLALIVGALAIYALGALACNSPKIGQWAKEEQKSAKTMLSLLIVATLALVTAACFFPLPERGTFKLW